ncbi:MAG: redox-regulated ATPase YchF [bacterium]
MKLGIIGLPQVGKQTLFNLLTQGKTEKTKGRNVGAIHELPLLGIAEVREERLAKLAQIYQSRKITPVTVEYFLFPNIQNDAEKTRQLLSGLSDTNAVVHLVRAFTDESIFHASGSVDVFRDIERINDELIFSDLFKIERRFERLEKELKKLKDTLKEKEFEALKKCKALLEDGTFLREAEFSAEEEKLIRGFQFLTQKGLLIIINVDENKLNDFELLNKIREKYQRRNTTCIQVSVKVEQEINQLPESERAEYMDALGIKKSAMEEITQSSFRLLDLVEFFTAGEQESRAWSIRRGKNAQQAGGEIHSDIERGFIRAELIKYNDLMSSDGNPAKAKEKGIFYLKGKDYIVEDGDILLFRFNV